MTAAILKELPLAAGSALLGALAKAALWGAQRYARAPLANTGILALGVFSMMATGNALYLQTHRHPSPLFSPFTQVAEAEPVPVVPAVRKPKMKVPAIAAPVTTASVPANTPIGNAEVFELQRKLQAFGLFDGTVDGYYGPKTARAIKKFEEGQGLKPKGELTPEVLKAILSAPIIAPQPVVAPLAAPEPVVEQPVMMTETVEPQPVAVLGEIALAEPAATPLTLAEPLPAPAPLTPALETASVPVADRPLPRTADEALEIASGVAGDAIDALVDAVNGKVQMGPAAQVMPEKVVTPEQTAVQMLQEPAPEASDTVAEIVTAEMTPVPTVPEAMESDNDPKLVAKVQRGLASLGFLRSEADGVAGEATAKAIRNFEVWNNYDVTGRVTPQLLSLLVSAGADV